MSQSKQIKLGRRWKYKLSGKALTDVGYNVTLESASRFCCVTTSPNRKSTAVRVNFDMLDQQVKLENEDSCSLDQSISEHRFTHAIEELGKFKDSNGIMQDQLNGNVQHASHGTSWTQHVAGKELDEYFENETSLFRDIDSEDDLMVYENFFYGCKHWNFFCVDDDIGEVILSLKMEILHGKEYVRLLVRNSLRSVHAVVPTSSIGVPDYCSDPYSWIGTLTQLLQLSRPFQLITHYTVGTELVKLDRVFVKSEFKIGLLYVKHGQKTEEEIFSNTSPSTTYERFLDLLGERVTLKGFTGYPGGLDTSNNLNGTESIYTEYRHNNIMFHVSTLMPNCRNDVKHLGKKRHIGNDVLCVVFTDEKETSFSPSWIKTQFIYTYILVQVVDASAERLRFKVSVICRQEVPWFGPCLSEDSTFEEGDEFRDWLLRKIVNGDRACYKAPKFASMKQRTRNQIMNSILEKEMVGQSEKTTDRRRPPCVPPDDNLSSVQRIFPDVPNNCIEESDPKLRYFCHSQNEELSYGDVTFLAGKTHKKRIYGVRSVMCGKSRVFREMLTDWAIPKSNDLNHLQGKEGSLVKMALKKVRSQAIMQTHSRKGKFAMETSTQQPSNYHVTPMSIKKGGKTYEISVDCIGRTREFVLNEFEADIFTGVIDYIHNDKCVITYETLPGLLCAATYYELPDLRLSCLNRQEDIINVQTVCPMLNIVEEYVFFKDGKELQQKLLNFFTNHVMKIIIDDHVTILSKSRIILLLSQDWKCDIQCKIRAATVWAKSRDFREWQKVAKSVLSSSQTPISEEMLDSLESELNTS